MQTRRDKAAAAPRSLAVGVAVASPGGDPVPTFDGDGELVVSSGGTDFAQAVTAQPDEALRARLQRGSRASRVASSARRRGHFALLVVSAFVTVIAAMTFASGSASAAVTFTNETRITIPDEGRASPYPSSINVQGQPGRITDIAVTLRGFTHDFVGDVDILLVSPDGDASVVISDICHSNAPVQNPTFAFSQSAATTLPVIGQCFGGFYRPVDHDIANQLDDSWEGAPAGPHSANVDRFIGANPNGIWSLYVIDDREDLSGRIDLGWALTIETAVPDGVVPSAGSAGTAAPYPMTRTVSGLNGVITDVDVSLSRVFHARPDDLDLLLVGPHGEKVTLMSDACGPSAVRSRTWGWDDEAGSRMADEAQCPTTTRYRPTDYQPGESLAAPAPTGPYGTALSAFDFTEPNGEWRLYAEDDLLGGSGFFLQRFELEIDTRPKAAVGFDAAALDVGEGETRELTLVRPSGGQSLGTGEVTVSSAPLSATGDLDYRAVSTKVEFAPGQTRATVPIEALADTLSEDAEAFAVTIGRPRGDAEPTAPATAVVTIRDRTPRPGGRPRAGGDPSPGVDREAPVIGPVTIAPRRFAVARRATAPTAARGTTIRYTLSEPATVTLRVIRARSGRTVGRLRRTGRADRNRVAFSGRIGRRPLRRDAYRLIVSAKDAAGNRSTARPRPFRITR